MCLFSLIKGKDQIIFVTKEDHETPSNAELIAEDPNDPYEEQGTSFNPHGKNTVLQYSYSPL